MASYRYHSLHLVVIFVTVLLLGCDNVYCKAVAEQEGEEFEQECPRPTPNWATKKGSGDHPTRIRFINESPVDLVAYWVNYQGQDREESPYAISAGGSIHVDTTTGHRFRVYTAHNGQDSMDRTLQLVKQYEVTFQRGRQNVRIYGCSTGEMRIQAPPDENEHEHNKEMEALVHDQDAPCVPHDDSTQWSCIRFISKEQYQNRVNDGTVYGFNSTVEAQSRNIGDTIDTGYTGHIPNIPRLATRGKRRGYLKMSFTQKMKDTLLPFYDQHKHGAPHDSEVDHGTIPGGYTNSHTVPMTKINLDNFIRVRDVVSDEIQRILEWWTGGQPLIPTATFGIRIYHSGSMLINHVDRADTHLASAVIQVAQEGMGTGWPLEIMHPDDGTVAEVYLQPGELVLYEGARFLHGRPMRLNGTSFANIFSHFKPVDWYGPGKSPKYDGFLDERGYLLPLEKINGGDGGEELVMKSDEL